MSISTSRRSNVLPLAFALGAWATGCASRVTPDGAGPDSTATAVAPRPKDTVRITGPAIVGEQPAVSRLPPLADTIAGRLVFLPTTQEWFVAAVRDKHLVVDLGRLDIDLKNSPARLAAFALAVQERSPVAKGTLFRLAGSWGSERATLTGISARNGRILGALKVSPLVDSLVAAGDPLIAAAQRNADTTAASVVDSVVTPCNRTSDPAFKTRLTSVAAAVEEQLRAAEQPEYPRLAALVKSRKSVVEGCFGAARGVVVVTLYAGDYEWVRERVLLVSDSTIVRVRVRDLRFRAHELLQALDANGDGIDDIAVRAWTPRGGGTALLTLNNGAQFERLAAGFSYER